MFVTLSPAKTLDYESPLPSLPVQTQPRFLGKSQTLVDILRKYDAEALGKLMKVSDKIAELNVERFALWQQDMTVAAARPAVFAFRGDVYTGLDIDGFEQAELVTAQQQLRILSGLYGLLRPLDNIRPYRLEMGTKLPNEQGKNLYKFWGEKLTRQLADDMARQGTDTLVNLASQEYFKSIKNSKLPVKTVHPVFQDEKNGQYKVISFYAKKARGLMAQWIIKNQAKAATDLFDFDMAGYQYVASESTDDKPVFRRAEADRA